MKRDEIAVPAGLQDTHMLIKIHIFDDEEIQFALVRKDINIDDIIKEIVKEFKDDAELDPDGNYALTLASSGDTPQPNVSYEKDLIAQATDETPELYFGWKTKRKISFLMIEEGIRITPELFPTTIGRNDSNAADTLEKIGVNLSASKFSKSVSREHGVLYEENEKYSIETSPGKQPIVLNDNPVLPGEKKELKSGDHVVIGRVKLEIEIR